MRLGILGCSDIAYRRFMPATEGIDDFEVVAVAEEYNKKKLIPFCEKYKLEGMESFKELIVRTDIDAIYIPQPPALHYEWARISLEFGKHVLIEKPSTISYIQSKKLVDIAEQFGLALHENYMFQYHSQVKTILNMIQQGRIGKIRQYRTSFGFPIRDLSDFRYIKDLGGGALLDAGGYTLKLSTLLLGNDLKVKAATLNYIDGYEVDMYGNAYLSNGKGEVCQVGFGMDCSYQCGLEAWGSSGRIVTDRIYTAPEKFNPIIVIEDKRGVEKIELEEDSHFRHSIEHFILEIKDNRYRKKMYREILTQARLIEEVKAMAN